jgi:hypothetical protein
MAGVPRSMVSLASQRSRTTTSASTASGQRSPRPRHRCMSGVVDLGRQSRAGRLGAARPTWHRTAPGLQSPPEWSACGQPPSASFAIWLMLVVTGPPDMGQTPPAGRGIRPYGTGPDWKSLSSVRKETLARGGEVRCPSPNISAARKLRGSTARIAILRRMLERPHRPRTAAAAPAPTVFRRVWQEVAPGQWR